MAVCPSCGASNPARARFCMSCAAPLPEGGPDPYEARKVVTVVFCDVVGSTPLGERLDPESVRRVMTRFFEEMRAPIERHGGTVAKFIGDAVMAVFGVPTLHEDDALRAVRAAAEMRAALDDLNVELERVWHVTIGTRTGINTGEVVVGDPSAGESLVVADAVNVAARLEQTAMPGEILLGPDTFSLVRDVVTAEEGRPFTLKGKAAPVLAYRLLDAGVGEPRDWRMDSPLVGRDRELASLRRGFEQTAEGGGRRLLTVLGPAGVGKSRLAREFVVAVRGEAVVARGRCLPYGDGITFWPIAELVKEACAIADGEPVEAARSKIVEAIDGVEDAELIADRVAGVVGIAPASAGTQEIFWAIRRFLESLRGGRPLVVVFDDLQWAEPTFLDLVEYLAGSGPDEPILLLCLARPDLLDLRPDWGIGAGSATTTTLTPLTPKESEELIRNLLGSAPLDAPAVPRIVEAAAGNPLFVEEMLRMLEDDGLIGRDGGRWRAIGDLSRMSVPATIQALLGARLDRLSAEERTVIGCASVIGNVFWWGAVADLAPERLRTAVGGHLRTLVRKEMIRPEPSGIAGEDAFRFHHILIQEAAYRGLPKEQRAELHERFAAWLERTIGERLAEYEEILGYHLEQAFRYRLELGAMDDRTREIATGAAERLASAGRRALGRDMAAAVNLLERASSLYPDDAPARLSLLPDLGEALMVTGELSRADEVLSEAMRGAEAIGDRGLRSHAVILRLLLMESTDPKDRSDEALRELEGVIPVFEQLGDDLGLTRAWQLMGDVYWTRARYAEVDRALERAIEHARRAGADWEEAECLSLYTVSGLYGPAPVPDVVHRCEEALKSARGNRSVEAGSLRTLASLRAMQGEFDEGRDLARHAKALLEDLGLWLRAAFASEASGFVETLAGDFAAAEVELRSGLDVIEKLGERGYLSTVAALLAHAVLAQGRLDDADGLIRMSDEAAAEDDLSTQVLVRTARGRILAARGAFEEALPLFREAMSLAEETDDVNMRADVVAGLGEVLAVAGRRDEAARILEDALLLYEGKGNLVSAGRVRGSLIESTGRAR
jgi:class 3 adenylate cyclase/tetratricopeptide (TPR) repeat protein